MSDHEQCPICKRDTLHKHCPSPTCTWHHCRSYITCDAVLDLTKGRGHALNPEGQGRVKVTLEGEPDA